MNDRHRGTGASRGALLALLLGLASVGTVPAASAASAGSLADSSSGGPRLPLPIHFASPSTMTAGPRVPATPSQVQADNGVWVVFSPPSPNPPTPVSHIGIFDTAHNRMVIHGGFGLVTDTWQLDLGSMTWTQIVTANTPPQRWAACAIYDAIGDRLVMFGGYSQGQYSSDLWVLPMHGNPTWLQISPPPGGPWPGPRLYASAIYDPVRHRMIVFGGEAGASFNDTWALSLDNLTWTQMLPTGTIPTERFGHSAVYDPGSDQMVMFGGGSGDVWTLTLGATPAWSHITTSGPSPVGRSYHTAVMDTRQERMIVHGGYGPLSDTWQLTLGANPAWTELQPTGPTPVERWLHNALYDATNSRMIVFGGSGTGDLRAVYWTSQASTPAIFSLDPSGGFDGDHVLVHGVFTETPVGAKFNGADATIFASAPNTIQLIVPAGASSGPVSISFPSGTLTSPMNFTIVHPPIITSSIPSSAPIGAMVKIYGQYFTGATRVTFGSNSVTSFSVISDGEIHATVDPNAVSGPIRVFGPFSSAISPFSFTVIRHVPILTSVTPTHGTFGAVVTIAGQFFSSASLVSFGPNSSASFNIDSDVQITATVDGNAVTGPISITNIDGTAASAFTFVVTPPVYPPTLVAVFDAPNDQGGKLILEWLASDFDLGQNHSVTKYRIWRRAPLFGAHALPALGFLGEALPLTGAPAGFWESIGEIPAARIPGYAFTAPTLQDSLPDSNPYTAFIVQSVTSDPSQLYFSDPDSGYSVDNLPPPIPTPFSASYGPAVTHLHWAPSRAPDFAEFRLYRGGSADFDPGSGNLLVATNDTSFVDVESNSFYKLAAIDLHGNHSKYAVVSPSQPVAVLAALTFVDPQPDRIRLTWYAAGEPNLSATLYRRTPGADWTRITMLTSNAGGLLQYEDRAVIEGGLYGYRLGIMDAGVEVFAGEVWATASRPALALEGILPNPAVNGRFSVAFALPTNESARLEVVDVTGRRVATREVGSLGPGRHQLSLGGGEHLPPGVYLVHLVQAQTSRTARVVVIE